MEELRPEDPEELVRELEEEYDTDEPLPLQVETKIRVCPQCGKHNSESA